MRRGDFPNGPHVPRRFATLSVVTTRAAVPRRQTVLAPAGRLAVVALAVLGLALTAPTAHADPLGDVYSVTDTRKASEFIQAHSGEVTAGTVGASTASAFCGPLASGCVALVNAANGAYQVYAANINTAARSGSCLAVYFGDTAGGGVSGIPYVGGYSGPGCRASGAPTEMDDDVVRAFLQQKRRG